MKTLILLTAIIIFSTLLIADSPKYDFNLTVTIEGKSIKDIQKVLADFEVVARKHKGTVEINIVNHGESDIMYFQGQPYRIPSYQYNSQPGMSLDLSKDQYDYITRPSAQLRQLDLDSLNAL